MLTSKFGPSRRATMVFPAVALVFGLNFAASDASAQTVEFRGGGYLENFTAACGAPWVGTTQYISARYRPPKLGSNGPSTRLAFFIPLFYAEGYLLPSGALNANFKNVQAGLLASASFQFSGQAKLRVTSRNPATVNANTESVSLTGQVNRFNDLPNCRVDFSVSMTRQR